jgi:hypothetical protein
MHLRNRISFFRPFPYRDRNGKFVGGTSFGLPPTQSGGYTPPSDRASAYADDFTIPNEAIMGAQLQRSDDEVFNYYFTDATYMPTGLSYEAMARANYLRGVGSNPIFVTGAVTLDTPIERPDGTTQKTLKATPKLEHSRMEIYGFRKFQTATRYLSLNPDTEDVTKVQAKSEDATGTIVDTGDKLNKVLFDSFEHNSQLEVGIVTIRGDERIRPGMYVNLDIERLNNKPQKYYVSNVSHILVPFESFVTQLTVERGEGFHMNRSLSIEDIEEALSFLRFA